MDFWTITSWSSKLFWNKEKEKAQQKASLTVPSVYRPMPITTKDLHNLSIKPEEIKKQVQDRIKQVKDSTHTKEKFIDNARKFLNQNEWYNTETWTFELLKEYKKRGYAIKWINIEEELNDIWTKLWYDTSYLWADEQWKIPWFTDITKNKNTVAQKEKPSFLWEMTDKTIWLWWDLLWWVKNVVWWAVSEAPTAVWDTLWFFADVLTPKEYEWLWEALRLWWERDKAWIQKAFWIDKDNFTTKTWEFWLNIWLMFTPIWKEKLIAQAGKLWEKAPQAIKYIEEVWKKIEQFAVNFPKAYKNIQSVLAWWWQAAKFDIMTEWEISPTSVALWAVANPLIDKAIDYTRWFISSDAIWWLKKIIWPSQKGTTNKQITNDMQVIAEAYIENKTIKNAAKTQLWFYTDLEKIWQDIYKNKINPAITKAVKEWKSRGYEIDSLVWTNKIIDDVLNDMVAFEWKKPISDIFQWNKAAKKEIDSIIKILKKDYSKIDLPTAERLKKWFVLQKRLLEKEWWIVYDFVNKFDAKLAKTIDDKIEELLWADAWIIKYKKQYWAIARHLRRLDEKIIRADKKTSETIASWVWKQAGFAEIAQWKFLKWATELFSTVILRRLRDPDTIIQNTMKQLFKWNKIPTWKIPWIGSSISGNYLDKNFTNDNDLYWEEIPVEY